MKLGGYGGHILSVDLGRGTIEKEPLAKEIIEKFIGGEGGNFKLAYDLIKPQKDAFDESMPLIFGVGPCVGSFSPSCHRTLVTFKHSNFGGVVESAKGGGTFGTQMKWAGYDYLIITGKSTKPVFLLVCNDEVKILDGKNLWGKDIYETTDLLWERFDNPSVYAIGPAAEKLVNTTVGLIDKLSTCGKGGLAAVMGSKKLKAIAFKGTKGIRIADPKRLEKVTIPLLEKIKNHPAHKRHIDLGTMVGWDAWFKMQGASSRNWSSIYPIGEAERLYGVDEYLKNIKKDRIADPGCPVGCKDHVFIKCGEFAGLDTYGSSLYGRLENFAARCNVGSFNRFVKCLDYCNRKGLCVHEVTALIDWAIDLYKHKIIDKTDTGGLDLDWDFNTTMQLMEKIAENEGFGAILGGGILHAMEKLDRGCDKLAIHVKGMMPLYDARVNRVNTAEFGQITYPRGAHPGRASIPETYMTRGLSIESFKKWAQRCFLPPEAMRRIFEGDTLNIARLTKWAEDQNIISHSTGIGCHRGRVDIFYDNQIIADIFSSVTGWEITPRELRDYADRSYTLLKCFDNSLIIKKDF